MTIEVFVLLLGPLLGRHEADLELNIDLPAVHHSQWLLVVEGAESVGVGLGQSDALLVVNLDFLGEQVPVLLEF